jgi:hypothetical protein
MLIGHSNRSNRRVQTKIPTTNGKDVFVKFGKNILARRESVDPCKRFSHARVQQSYVRFFRLRL